MSSGDQRMVALGVPRGYLAGISSGRRCSARGRQRSCGRSAAGNDELRNIGLVLGVVQWLASFFPDSGEMRSGRRGSRRAPRAKLGGGLDSGERGEVNKAELRGRGASYRAVGDGVHRGALRARTQASGPSWPELLLLRCLRGGGELVWSAMALDGAYL